MKQIINIIIYWTGFVIWSLFLVFSLLLFWKKFREKILKAYESFIKILTFVNEVRLFIFQSIGFVIIVIAFWFLLNYIFPEHGHLKLLK